VWPAEGVEVDVDETTMRARGMLPSCPRCGALARPNILRFGDGGWDGAHAAARLDSHAAWARSHRAHVAVVAAEIRKVKERTDGDIGMSGSATLVRWLLAHGLLDELNLLVHPIAVGHGRRLFEDTSTHPLRLVRHEAFETGVLHLTYAPE